jgi:Bacterial aa3 type cytochrome c oxidase subunit IV
MADHGEVEYATVEGNDLPAHEANYESFVHVTVIGAVLVVNILVGLAIGGVLGHWLLLAAVIIAAIIAAGISGWTGSRTPGIVVLALSLLTFLFSAYS